jgi:hypothetical protein
MHEGIRHRKVSFTALIYVLCATISYSLKSASYDDSNMFLIVS